MKNLSTIRGGESPELHILLQNRSHATCHLASTWGVGGSMKAEEISAAIASSRPLEETVFPQRKEQENPNDLKRKSSMIFLSYGT
jgi:hypothetical protein